MSVTMTKSKACDVQDVSRNSVIIFDGDDTLWITEPLYDYARSSAAKIVQEAGVDPVLWDQLERIIDVENVNRFGLSSERFPTSCVEAYQAAAAQTGVSIHPQVTGKIQSAASSVFRSVAPLADGAVQLLSKLYTKHQLILYTQGDPEIQEKRISDSGLRNFFEFMILVEHKTASDLSLIASKLELPPSSFFFVGNSVRSDINPALAVGMNAVWLKSHVWDYERQELKQGPGTLYEAADMYQVATLIEPALGSPLSVEE
ncbi:MAG: HAD family hydrolase [Acidimicrobiales bacterium]